MAESNTEQTMDSVRAELTKLRDQIEHLIRHKANEKASENADLLEKVNRELEYLRRSATERAQSAYQAGQAGIEQVGDQVRRNPILALAIAFGAGCLLSGFFRR